MSFQRQQQCGRLRRKHKVAELKSRCSDKQGGEKSPPFLFGKDAWHFLNVFNRTTVGFRFALPEAFPYYNLGIQRRAGWDSTKEKDANLDLRNC
jgi:hypothetical protein